MPRILIAECIHEVSSFNPVPTRYEDFYVRQGPTILDFHRGLKTEVGGALEVFADVPGTEIVPTYSARGITSGGTIPAPDFTRLATEFLVELRKVPKPDAIYFALHGAMAAENELDPEGYLLEETRKLFGQDIPLVASFDLHGILTDRMLEHTDAISIYHTYPHVDFFETGQRAAKLLVRLLAKDIRPVTAKVFIPALVRGDELITATGIFGTFIRQAAEMEQSRGGLSAGMFIGNPFTDVPALGTNSVVCTDNDPERAEREATRLAEQFWEHRGRMQAPLTPLAEGIRLAAETKGTVVLMDAADATSSGASGDSNAILREMIRAGYRGKALIPIVDPPAVERAFNVGVGGRVETSVGGALDRKRFQPLPIQGTVRMLSDGRFMSESWNQEWHSGRSAVIRADNYTIIVTSRPVHLFDRSLFYGHGQDPKHFDAVVVKSPHCQQHMFAAWCARLVNVDAPGSTSANLRSLGHTVCGRPIFPLDAHVPFTPRAQLFRARCV